MRGPYRRCPGAPTSTAVASTSSKRDPEEDSAEASEESGDDEEVSSPSGSESESESDGDDERERELERALADVPFGELQRARADGSIAARVDCAAAAEKKARRASKKRPMEISTKVRPPRLKEVIQVPKKVQEKKLQKTIKKSKDPNAIEDMKNRITWIDKQFKSHPQKNIESEILREHIKKEREAAQAGKRPYYLKKSELHQRKLMTKYNELKEAGKLDAYMERRRKKNASKDHRYMPYRRNVGGA